MSTRVYLSVVSHGHVDVISGLECLPALAKSKEIQVVVKNNVAGDSRRLQKYCAEHNIGLVDDHYGKGFGQNNNIVYKWCRLHAGLTDEDYFLVVNPDVSIDARSVLELKARMAAKDVQLSSINLYLNEGMSRFDYSIRCFPGLCDFASSLLGFGNSTKVDKSSVQSEMVVDWAAGSFLMFKADLYGALSGFDESYFMYCEDIDICFRAGRMGRKLMYFPDIRAVHYAKHQNRKIFSRHFLWHLFSAGRFLLKKHGFFVEIEV